jgi:ribosomal protein S18 acetylase RimI-like enzyme
VKAHNLNCQRQQKSVSVQLLHGSDEVANYASQIARWAYQSSPEYFDLLFSDELSALARLEKWALRRDSEYSGFCCTILLDDGMASGGVIAFGGNEQLQRRRADLFQLFKELSRIERDELKSKLAHVAHLADTAQSTDFYIRALAIDPKARRHGLGTHLLTECVQRGFALGFSRVRLEVRADNLAAIRFYERAGFQVISESEIAKVGWSLHAMIKLNSGVCHDLERSNVTGS